MEKSQDRIKFENLYNNSLSTWWSKYPFESFGSVIHWIYVYTNLNIAEQVTVGNNEVNYNGKLVARYTFNDKLQIPLFYHINDEIYPYFSENQEIYITGLTRFKDYVDETDKRYKDFKNLLRKNV